MTVDVGLPADTFVFHQLDLNPSFSPCSHLNVYAVGGKNSMVVLRVSKFLLELRISDTLQCWCFVCYSITHRVWVFGSKKKVYFSILFLFYITLLLWVGLRNVFALYVLHRAII